MSKDNSNTMRLTNEQANQQTSQRFRQRIPPEASRGGGFQPRIASRPEDQKHIKGGQEDRRKAPESLQEKHTQTSASKSFLGLTYSGTSKIFIDSSSRPPALLSIALDLVRANKQTSQRGRLNARPHIDARMSRAKTQRRKGKSTKTLSALSKCFKQNLEISAISTTFMDLPSRFSSGPPALPVQCCNARQRPIGATPPLLTKQPINQTTNQPAAGPIASQRANQQTSQRGASRRNGFQPRTAWSGEAQRREMSHTKTRRHEGKSAGTQQKKREQGEPEDRRRAQGHNRNSVLLTSQRANQATSRRFTQILEIDSKYRNRRNLAPSFSSGSPALPVQCSSARQRPIGETPPLLTKKPINKPTNQPAVGPCVDSSSCSPALLSIAFDRAARQRPKEQKHIKGGQEDRRKAPETLQKKYSNPIVLYVIFELKQRSSNRNCVDSSSGPPVLPVQSCSARERPIGGTPPPTTKQPINQATNQRGSAPAVPHS